MRELTLEEVQAILTEGVALARAKGFPSTVAVVDMGGNLRGLLRPEKGRIANPDIAIKKAWTAAALHRSTAQVRELMITPDRFGHGLQFTNERFCMVAGGFPIKDEAGDIIGGVGTSGGPVELDIECSLVGLRKLGFPTDFADPLAATAKPAKTVKAAKAAATAKAVKSTVPASGGAKRKKK
ncbi:MAG TPA: heme-binding protein [Immundisolibacter sp.]|nr:heme-binding protein [Immundisolibacter sp.]